MINLILDYIRGSISLILFNLSISLSYLLVAPIIINSLGFSVYGSYLLIISTIPIIIAILSLGLGFIGRRKLPSSEDIVSLTKYFFPQFWSRLFILSFSLMIAYIIFIFFEDFLKLYLGFNFFLILPFVLLFSFFDQFLDFFRYTHRITFYSFMSACYALVTVGLIYVLLEKEIISNLNDLLLVNLFTLSILNISLFLKVASEIGFKIKFYENKKAIIDDLKVGFPAVLNNLNETFINIGDRYLIGWILGMAAVGFYTPAYALASLPVIFARTLTGVLPPLLSKMHDDRNYTLRDLVLRFCLKYFIHLALGYFLICFLLGNEILEFYINEEFAFKSLNVYLIISFSATFAGVNLVFSNLFVILLKTKFMLKTNLLSFVINLVLNIILLYIFEDIVVAAITTLVCFLIVFQFYRLELKKDMSIILPLKDVMLVFSYLLFSTILFLIMDSFLNLNLLSSLGCFILLLLSPILVTMRYDFKNFKQLIRA